LTHSSIAEKILIYKVIKIVVMKDFQSFIIEETAKTPHVELNPITGDFIFSGRSIPENAAKVYEPILNWINGYILNARPTTNLRLHLEYFNTSSSLWLAKIFKVLVRIDNPDFVIIFHLYLPVDEFDEMREFEDIKEAFFPIADVIQFAIPSIGLRLYGTDEEENIVKDKLVFI
jgi:hypothetical protein